MKTLKYFTTAALALLMTTACSNDDNDMTDVEPQQAQGITITAQLAPKDGVTRSLSDDATNGKIVSNWVKDETLAILYENAQYTEYNERSIATVTSVDNETGVATITFTIQQGYAYDNTPCTIVYPASAAKTDNSGVMKYSEMLSFQDGKLSGKLDVRVGEGIIQITTPSLDVTKQPVAQHAICKFSLKSGNQSLTANKLIVRTDNDDIITTVDYGNGTTDEVYVALPAMTTQSVRFVAFKSDSKYNSGNATATLRAGKFYPVDVTFPTEPATTYPIDLADATADELGFLVGQNGKAYYDADGITADNTTAVGVIAYLGNDAFSENGTDVGGSAFTGHGLVLCLKNAANNVKWSTTFARDYVGNDYVTNAAGLKRSEGVSGYNATKALATANDAANVYPAAYAAWNYSDLPVPEGATGWFLPTAQQWVRMLTGLGGLSEDDITLNSKFDTGHSSVDKLNAALAKAGSGYYESITTYRNYYRTSSEATDGWTIILGFTIDAGRYYYNGLTFYTDAKNYSDDGTYRVRPVFAF